MEPDYLYGMCPSTHVNCMWYIISVLCTFAVGALWYGVLFKKAWINAVRYECVCGAKLSNEEKCTCKSHSMLPMIFQFVATALVGLMYFVVTDMTSINSVYILVAVSAWITASLKFRIAEWDRFFTLASIDVGYFFVASLIFIGLAML